MAARSGTRYRCRKWIHPRKSGIYISEVLNRSKGATFGASYQVVVPAALAGVRKRRRFAQKTDAESFAEDEFAGIRMLGQDYFTLTPAQRREVSGAYDLLKNTNIGLLEGVQFALKHMRPAGGDRSVQAVVDEMVAIKKSWLESKEIRERSFRDFRQRALKFAERFGSTLIRNVSLDDIKTWLKTLNLSGRSRKNYRMVVGEVLKYAVQKKFRADNPMQEFTRADKREIEPAADEQREPSVLSVGEAERLLNTAFAHPEMDLGAAVVLALFCGIRTEELKRLEWNAVRLDDPHPFVKIDRSIAKKRRIRNVEIPACAQAWLRVWPRRSGKVTRNTYVTDYVKRFAKLTRLAGFGSNDEHGEWVSGWDDNCMRHSFGSYTYALTGDSMRTASLLGHKGNDQVLFDHYRALTTKAEAEKYFALMPPPTGQKVVAFA